MVKNFRIYKNFNLSKKDKEAIILIGNFDGLHRGHQKLFNKAKNFKKKFSNMKKVKPNFNYNSKNNKFLNIFELKNLIKKSLNKF